MKSYAEVFAELVSKYNIIESGELVFKDESKLIISSLQDETKYEIED